MTGGEVAAAAAAADPVDVWLVDDDVPGPGLEFLCTVLDPAERQRANTAMTAADRRRFIVAHAAVRHVVGDRLGVPPENLRWAIGAHGKPELRGTGEGLRVNLSHSDGQCMVAVSASRPVGVDIQCLVADATAVALARRYFPALESRLVQEAADGSPAVLFARLWARKEAVVKAAGTRLSLGLAVPVHGVCPLTVAMDVDGVPESYRVVDVAAPEGFRAAVALAGDAAVRVMLHQLIWSAADGATASTSNAARYTQLWNGS